MHIFISYKRINTILKQIFQEVLSTYHLKDHIGNRFTAYNLGTYFLLQSMFATFDFIK